MKAKWIPVQVLGPSMNSLQEKFILFMPIVVFKLEVRAKPGAVMQSFEMPGEER